MQCCSPRLIVRQYEKRQLCAPDNYSNMKKEYTSAPLPFVGQKRRFASEYRMVLNTIENATVFVDLFGGSGLLSHITKRQCPDARVIYNDYDNYRLRLEHIEETNLILAKLRDFTSGLPRHKIIPAPVKERILSFIKQKEKELGFVDYITISSSLLFSMKYVLSWVGLAKETLYNNVRQTDYQADGYLDGLEIVSCDYRELFDMYKNRSDVVFLVDPPYLSTDVGTYNMCWGLSDYLDVLTILNGHRYVYFTSAKSSIIELCEWMGKNRYIGNPFANSVRKEVNVQMNHNSRYTDIMFCKVA